MYLWIMKKEEFSAEQADVQVFIEKSHPDNIVANRTAYFLIGNI